MRIKNMKVNDNWRAKFKRIFVDNNLHKSEDDMTAYVGIGNIEYFIEDTIKDIVGRHNANILNEYQNQELGDERLIFKVIETATNNTLDDVRQVKGVNLN